MSYDGIAIGTNQLGDFPRERRATRQWEPRLAGASVQDVIQPQFLALVLAAPLLPPGRGRALAAVGAIAAGLALAGLHAGIEVPAAALKAAAFARHVDFMSIGTNDLTQYALAADRNNDAVASIGDTFDPGLLQLIRATCRGAEGQAAVSVCGEFAADERAVPLLLGMGVESLSVTPPAIPTTKEAVRAVDRISAQRLAETVLVADSAAAVRELLE